MKNSIFALAMLLTGTLSFASTGEIKDVKEPAPAKVEAIYCVYFAGELFCCEAPSYDEAQACAREMARSGLKDIKPADPDSSGQSI